MSIQYKMVGMNDNLNPTDKKKTGYYPTVIRKKTVGIAELVNEASQHCSMNNFELEMAAKVLLQAIKTELLNSNHVCLEGFGTFSLKAGSRTVQTPTELRAESIHVKKVAFKNSTILLSEMKKAVFEKYTER
jgi:predicted histone-like DNA-binding protein